MKGEEIGTLAEPSSTIRMADCGVRDLMSTFDRLLFEIDIGIPAEACANDLSSSKYQAPLEKVIAQVSEITGGLSYQYVQGTWTAEDSGEVHQEKDATLNLRIIILPEDREGMFDKILFNIISISFQYVSHIQCKLQPFFSTWSQNL